MGTKDFNALDLFICRWRSGVVRRHLAAGARVLDFGCGHQAMFLRSVQHQIAHGVGLDYDADPTKTTANLELRQFHFKDLLPFPSHRFDRVAILAVLEHIPPEIVDTLFREFHRVLTPGGEVLITTPTPAARPVLEFLAFKLHVISESEIADHRHYYSKADLHALATRHGFALRTYRRFLFGFNCFSAFSKPVV